MRNFINIVNESTEPPAMDEKAVRKRVREILAKQKDILSFAMDEIDGAAHALAKDDEAGYNAKMAQIAKMVEHYAKLVREDRGLRPDYFGS